MEERAKWQMVAWAVAGVLLVVAAVRLLGPARAGQDASPPVRIDGGAAGPTDVAKGSGGSEPLIYVHVAGEVRRPGLFRVAEGSRVAVALHRAGGPTGRAELAAVNLAQPLEDGQQVVVPRAGPGGVATAAGGVGATAGSGSAAGTGGAGGVPLSLALATPEQLEQLDGIGPTLAQRIIDYRDENGGFRSIGQLGEVEGIGEKRMAALKEAVRP